MNKNQEHLQQLTEIRSLMERSTKFISLSGLSGIVAGFCALAGVALASARINHYLDSPVSLFTPRGSYIGLWDRLTLELIAIAIGVLVVSLGVGLILTVREAKRNKQGIWDRSSRMLLESLLIPLGTGGIFCLMLIYYHMLILVWPVTLIFYGLALVSASKYTFGDIKYLGILEIGLGLVGVIFLHKSMLIWALGFGVLHIVYGAVMHFKHNRRSIDKEMSSQ